jgi:hypothetical protein
MASNSGREGGCLCGAIRYRIEGEPVFTAICHCSMCRRASAAPAVAWAMYPQPQVTFVKGTPATYHSSPGAQRGFCNQCGTQISFVGEIIPGLIDITIGSLDAPDEVAPMLHYWESKRVSWLHIADDLPRFAEFPPAPGT